MLQSQKYIRVNCPVCSSFEYIPLFVDYNRRDNINCFGAYVQCMECTCVYLRERPRWNEIVKFYSSVDEYQTANTGNVDADELKQHIEKSTQKWKQVLRKIHLRPHSWPLESVPPLRKRLLDLGCGNGTKLFEFINRGYEVWGVDVGADSIRLCRDLIPQGHFIQGELQDTGLPDNYFDYIRIDNVLEHVPNPKEVIIECRRILCGNGKILIYVPHGKSLSMRLLKENSISAWIPFHLQLFTQKSLKMLLNKAGFDDLCIYYYNPTSWLPLSIIQWINRRKPVVIYDYPHWLTLVCYPLGWFTSKLRMAEEIIAKATKK